MGSSLVGPDQVSLIRARAYKRFSTGGGVQELSVTALFGQ